MDGVLIDSTPAVARVWRKWAKRYGFNPDEVAAYAQGRPSIATIEHYLPAANHVELNLEVESMEMSDLEGVIALPGAVRLLKSLPPEKWAIVTSSTLPLAKVRIQAAQLPVPRSLITSSDITQGKPHPQPYLAGAKLLGAIASQCIVIEDVPVGVQAGKRAGMRVVAVLTTSPAPALLMAGADWTVGSCADLEVITPQDGGMALELRILSI